MIRTNLITRTDQMTNKYWFQILKVFKLLLNVNSCRFLYKSWANCCCEWNVLHFHSTPGLTVYRLDWVVEESISHLIIFIDHQYDWSGVGLTAVKMKFYPQICFWFWWILWNFEWCLTDDECELKISESVFNLCHHKHTHTHVHWVSVKFCLSTDTFI